MRSPKSEVRSPKLLVRHLLAALCFLLSAFAGNAADLYVSLSDFSLTNLVNRRVIVTGNSLPRGVEGSVVVADTKSYTVTNAFWISNCVAGLYLFEVQAPPTTTTFRVLVPDTNGVVYAHSNLVASANNTYPPDTVAWGTAASDARYLRRGEAAGQATNVYHSAAGTGVTITTNGYLYTLTLDTSVPVAYAATAGSVTGAVAVATYATTAGSVTGAVDVATYATTAGSVTGTVAVASYAATSGVSTNATHTNAVATAGNVSGAVISGNGSGLSNAVAIAAGENVTVTTNSGRLFTLSASSSGSATNIMRSAAGSGIDISTNGLLYTFSFNAGILNSYALLIQNNLADVDDLPTARTNLGLHTVDNFTAGELAFARGGLGYVRTGNPATGLFGWHHGLTTNGWFSLVNGFYVDTENFILEVDSAYPMQYAATSGSVTGTVAVASYAATSGVSTNATHTNAVATAGNISGAVISGNGSGLSNAVAIAAGENVTVTTNSGRLFTLSASSSGSATNIMRSAAGSGIDISTNGLLYTFSFNAGILNSYALLIQNNLADVDDLPTARTNLGLHTVDNFTAGELAFARGGLGYVRTGNPATGLFGWHHGLTTNGWFSLVNGFYVDTENFILEVDSAYPMQYAATSGSVTGTVAVASYAATSGVSTNATHTNAVATAGNVSGAVISGNGSGLSNAVAIAAGENVTVTTNSGRLFTIAASSSGSATNIMRSAAGTGVLISTNGLLYTLSLDTAVPVSYAATAGTVTGAVAVAVAAGDHVTVTTNGGVYTVNSTAGSLSGPWVENEGTIVMPYDVVDGQWRATNVISIGNGGALVLPDWDDENYSSLIFAGNKIQVGSGDGAPGSAVFGAGTQTGDQFFWLASTHKFAGHGGALTNLNAGCIADGLTATRYLYTTNLSGAPITNTITISNGLIMSWTQ